MQAPRDENRVPTLMGVSNGDGITPVVVYADPVTHRVLVNNVGGATGTPIVGEVLTGALGQNTFTLAHTPIAGTLIVFGEGGQQLSVNRGDYTVVGTTVVLTNIPTQYAPEANYNY